MCTALKNQFNSKKNLNIFLKYIFCQLISADIIVFFFDPENMKKTPSKVAHNRPTTFFMHWSNCPDDRETEILYHQMPLNAGLGI